MKFRIELIIVGIILVIIGFIYSCSTPPSSNISQPSDTLGQVYLQAKVDSLEQQVKEVRDNQKAIVDYLNQITNKPESVDLNTLNNKISAVESSMASLRYDIESVKVIQGNYAEANDEKVTDITSRLDQLRIDFDEHSDNTTIHCEE